MTEPTSNEIESKEMEINETKKIYEVKVNYQQAFNEEVVDKEESMNHTQNPLDNNKPSILIGLLDSLEPEVICINARANVAPELAAEENKKKEPIPPENLVPEEFHACLDIFSETEANC